MPGFSYSASTGLWLRFCEHAQGILLGPGAGLSFLERTLPYDSGARFLAYGLYRGNGNWWFIAGGNLPVPVDDGLKITAIELQTEVKVPGIDEKTFQEKAEAVKDGCPVSITVAGTDIELQAKLLS